MTILVIIAIWRLGLLVSEEDGPYDIFGRFRSVSDGTGPRFRLIDLGCFNCVTVWISLPFAIIMFSHDWFVYWMALAGGAMVVDSVYQRIV